MKRVLLIAVTLLSTFCGTSCRDASYQLKNRLEEIHLTLRGPFVVDSFSTDWAIGDLSEEYRVALSPSDYAGVRKQLHDHYKSVFETRLWSEHSYGEDKVSGRYNPQVLQIKIERRSSVQYYLLLVADSLYLSYVEL